MKFFLCFFSLIYFTHPCVGQTSVQFSTTEVLDKYEKKFRHWGGDNETIRFIVIRKIVGVDTTVFAQCEVENKDWEKTSQSTGVAVGANGGWAVGISDVETLEKKKGIIRFNSSEFGSLINYLNQFISLSKSGDLEFDKTWTATFNARFSISLTFAQSKLYKWSYVLSIDGAIFEIPVEESLEMIKKLAGFRRLLKD